MIYSMLLYNHEELGTRFKTSLGLELKKHHLSPARHFKLTSASRPLRLQGLNNMNKKYAKSWKQAKKMRPFNATWNDLIVMTEREMILQQAFINKLK